MALKSLLLVSILVTGMAIPLVEAQLGGLGNLLGLIQIQGTVFCTANGYIGVNARQPQYSPVNALVQLQCGAGKVVSSSTTNPSGIFSIFVDPIQFLLSSLLTDCKLVVNTPLSTCNSALPLGILQSPLQLVGRILLGLLSIVNIVPAGFTLIPLS